MALEDTIAQQAPAPQQAMEEQAAPEGQRLSDEEEDDLAIAVMLAENMIDDGGISIIQEALSGSSDPAQVIGQFLMQLMAQMSEQLPPEAQFSPKILFAVGGWVEQVSDYLQEQYDVPREVMDRAEIFIATQAQSMANGAVQQQAQAAPAGAPPQAGLEGMMGGMA